MKLLSGLLFTACVLAACDEVPRQTARLPASEKVLSRYQTILIGDNALSLPTIMLLSSTKHSSVTLHDGQTVPIDKVLSQHTDGVQAAIVHINIDSYRELQDYDLDTYARASNEFCGNLTKEWETKQCRLGLYNGKSEFHPRSFDIVERNYLANSKEQLFAIAGSGALSGGAAARILLNQPSPSPILCEPGRQPLCTAITPIRDDLVAVWATRREDIESDRSHIHWIVEQYLQQ